MKSFTAISTLLAVASAVSPVKERQAATIDVTGFDAHTITGGRESFFNFDVQIPNGGPKTSCSHLGSAAGNQLPSVALGEGSCADASVRWQFQQQPSIPSVEGPYRLVVVHAPSRSQGWHEWPATDFPMRGEGVSQIQVYTGPADFSLNADN